MLILGDVDIKRLMNQKSHVLNKVMKFCNRLSLKQLVKEPTRSGHTISTIIDHFYINSHDIMYCRPLRLIVSDHLPVAIVRKKKYVIVGHSEFSGRSYLRYNELFEVLLNEFDWNVFFKLNNVNEMWDQIYSL